MPDLPAVLGELRREGGMLSFEPRFPFIPGLPYTARLQLPGRPPLLRTFEIPAAPERPPLVAAVFPSGDVFPENALRLYVHFSQPMETRNTARQVRVLDAAGNQLALPFVEIEHGLWDPQHRRLTLLFHPGRVKRGVGPREWLGPALRDGGEYRLVVDGSMRDARGQPLGAGFERRFRVGPADRVSPRIGEVRVTSPDAPGSALLVDLPEALDEALLRRLVWVEDAAERRLEGAVEVGTNEIRGPSARSGRGAREPTRCVSTRPSRTARAIVSIVPSTATRPPRLRRSRGPWHHTGSRSKCVSSRRHQPDPRCGSSTTAWCRARGSCDSRSCCPPPRCRSS